MRIQHIRFNELAGAASEPRRRWLEATLDRLFALPDHPQSRILVAADGDRIHAVLGLELAWSAEGRLELATIRVLEIDPDHFDPGVGARLVRVAEDIAHINGCDRVCAEPGLERWNAGKCRPTFGRDHLWRPASQGGTTPTKRNCA